MAPFFVAIVGLPVYTIAGAALMGTFITSVASVAFYQYLSLLYTNMAVAPDWLLGILFGFGGLLGMYLGARTQKFVPARVKYQEYTLRACSFCSHPLHNRIFRLEQSPINCGSEK